MSWFLGALEKYAEFSGRARRKEYWMYYLFYMIFMIIAAAVDNILGLTGASYYGPVYWIYCLAMLLPTLAVTVRRLHDLGKSGWWILIGLVPCIGGIWLLVLMCLEGTVGENEYGYDPITRI